MATTNADRLFVRDALREAFAGGPAAYEIAATLVYYESFGTHIPGQPSEPRRSADMWRYREPVGDRVRVGALLRGTLQNYDPQNYPPRQLVSEALKIATSSNYGAPIRARCGQAASQRYSTAPISMPHFKIIQAPN